MHAQAWKWFRLVSSNRTLRDDGNALYLPFQRSNNQAHVAMEHLECGYSAQETRFFILINFKLYVNGPSG